MVSFGSENIILMIPYVTYPRHFTILPYGKVWEMFWLLLYICDFVETNSEFPKCYEKLIRHVNMNVLIIYSQTNV